MFGRSKSLVGLDIGSSAVKAIELKPDYGEAHYALSFMCAMDPSNQANMAKGAEHFKRAMELGVEDERNLGQRFYPNVKIETH